MRIRFFALFCFVSCVMLGQSTPHARGKVPQQAAPRVGVATIKPSDPGNENRFYTIRGSHFVAQDQTVSNLIEIAYELQRNQVVGGPPWVREQRFDLEAAPDPEGKYSYKEWSVMLQQMLADRFKLSSHREMREMPVYSLAETRGGSKLSVTDDPDAAPNIDVKKSGETTTVVAAHAGIADFVKTLKEVVMGRPVIDVTGIEGRYDFTLKFAPDRNEVSGGAPAATPPDATPGLFTAMEEQLGLKLEPTRAAADVLVVENVAQPSAN
jgi:uncharacterized protein (TIGR03435 family)